MQSITITVGNSAPLVVDAFNFENLLSFLNVFSVALLLVLVLVMGEEDHEKRPVVITDLGKTRLQ